MLKKTTRMTTTKTTMTTTRTTTTKTIPNTSALPFPLAVLALLLALHGTTTVTTTTTQAFVVLSPSTRTPNQKYHHGVGGGGGAQPEQPLSRHILFSATEEAETTTTTTDDVVVDDQPTTATMTTTTTTTSTSTTSANLFFIKQQPTTSSDSAIDHADRQDDKDKKDVEGLPWWWEWVWQLDLFQLGEPGTEIGLGDSAYVFRTNIEQMYGGYPSLDRCPMAEGALDDIGAGTMFVGLQNYYRQYGSPYKLCFGPKSFLVISDPLQARHILRDANKLYDKGVLAEILKPIMGKGLIPADPETWSVRRKQIVPAFHQAWLNHMVRLFGKCNEPLLELLNDSCQGTNGKTRQVEMETLFCSVALDIIGLSIFNYDFGSVTKESPVIKAVYSALVEAEHRSMTPAPYWDLPLANQLVPRLRKFNADLKLLNEILDKLIHRAKETRSVEDIEELEQRNYDQVKDPSMLRFLVDMRNADIDNKQLRDDLMTMLIAGHETTAAVLTWALFELTRNPECLKQAQDEIDRVLGNDDTTTTTGRRVPTYQDIKDLKYLRLIVAETLRLYPEPPLLIRRCRTQHDLPAGAGREATVIRGMDIFIAIYNIHRDERFWPNPDQFDPLRFTRPYSNPDIPDWAGFDPTKWQDTKLYPTESAADFAYLPFGAGARKCVGDEFATLEATVTLAMVLQQFEFDFDPDFLVAKDDVQGPAQGLNHPVGMRTGATIHTRNGLNMLVKKRETKKKTTTSS